MQEFDAKETARVEEERLQELDMEKRRSDHERVEKARVRHKHAMEKETLKQVIDRTCIFCMTGRPKVRESYTSLQLTTLKKRYCCFVFGVYKCYSTFINVEGS